MQLFEGPVFKQYGMLQHSSRSGIHAHMASHCARCGLPMLFPDPAEDVQYTAGLLKKAVSAVASKVQKVLPTSIGGKSTGSSDASSKYGKDASTLALEVRKLLAPRTKMDPGPMLNAVLEAIHSFIDWVKDKKNDKKNEAKVLERGRVCIASMVHALTEYHQSSGVEEDDIHGVLVLVVIYFKRKLMDAGLSEAVVVKISGGGI